jgi:hypothetical protein
MRSSESLYDSKINYDELTTFLWFFIIVILNTNNFVQHIMMLVNGLRYFATVHIFCLSLDFLPDKSLRTELGFQIDI